MKAIGGLARSSLWRRDIRRLVGFTVLGLVFTVLLSLSISTFLDLSPASPRAASGSDGRFRWILTAWERPGAMLIHSHRERGVRWGPEQATGAPDAARGVDSPNAWASATQDDQREWLELEYADPVAPRIVRIVESHKPGAVDRVTALNEADEEVPIWAGIDPTSPASATGISDIPVHPAFATRRFKLYINSPAVPSWNEIDAVGLVDEKGRVQWAARCAASTTFGESAPTSGNSIAYFLPPWTGLQRPGSEFLGRARGAEDRCVKAAGWPMLAFWGEKPGSPQFTPSGTWIVSGPAGSAPSRSSPRPLSGARTLPLRPIWSGLLGDCAFYAALGGGLYWVTIVPRRFFRELSRLRHGRCIKCGYPLGYEFGRGCSECGWRKAGEQLPEANEPRVIAG
jgi:hypothetical protein